MAELPIEVKMVFTSGISWSWLSNRATISSVFFSWLPLSVSTAMDMSPESMAGMNSAPTKGLAATDATSKIVVMMLTVLRCPRAQATILV